MTYSELQKMDQETYRDRLYDGVCEVLDHIEEDFHFLQQYDGHADIHFAKSDRSLIDRILHEKVPASSCFQSERDAKENIANAILFKIEEIKDWFFTQKNEFSFEKDYYSLVLSLDTKEEGIGYGITSSLEKRITSAITLKLDRDTTSGSPYGIRLTTAYPDIVRIPHCVKTTGRLEMRDLLAMDSVFADNIEKLHTFCHYEMPELNAHYRVNQGVPTLSWHYDEGDRKLDIFLSEERTRIRERRPNGQRNVSFAELSFLEMDKAKQLTRASNALEAIQAKEFSRLPVEKAVVEQNPTR